ncbi:MAG: flippase-like domain-containing protein [Deltaproteobacteria bacterium]|nr:flippase-like domain-containing protein [Deltaproteobacteria bacterium]
MKRIISLCVSLLILFFIYSRIDFSRMLDGFRQCDAPWLTIALAMFVPLVMLTAWRFRKLAPSGSIGFFEANKLILVAGTMNMVLPSKMGDIAKAYFITRKGLMSGMASLALVIFEKTCDLLSLLVWCLFGLLFYRNPSPLFTMLTACVGFCILLGFLLLASRSFITFCFKALSLLPLTKVRLKLESFQGKCYEMQAYFWRNKRNAFEILAASLFIWFLHLLQIWLFILALKAWVPILTSIALTPLAIFIGLAPLTFAGIGTRDAALIFFYQSYFPASTAAALGILCTFRYVLPALFGLFFFHQYIALIKKPGMEKTSPMHVPEGPN